MIIKIDIKKAFDTIYWAFIENMLQLYNIRAELKQLILSCLKNIKFTPILNGKRTQYFRPSRGIRKGDHLSHIFILGMKLKSKYPK